MLAQIVTRKLFRTDLLEDAAFSPFREPPHRGVRYMSSVSHSDDGVFILGVHTRCGSNYVSDILSLHPSVETPSRICEDCLLENIELVERYVINLVEQRWRKRFDTEREFLECGAAFRRAIGDGMYRFLRSHVDPSKRLLTKTPYPKNVELFFDYFPRSFLLLLVRDGRDIVESAYRSWPCHTREFYMRRFATNARMIVLFMENVGKRHIARWKLVRYESLLEANQSVAEILRFLKLDESVFPWQKVGALPLRGSSTNRGPQTSLHWEPVERPPDFNPVERWKSWPAADRRRFMAIAGAEFVALGYEYGPDW